MSQILYPEKVDMTNCEKEPIHIIGKTQAHGVLVACDKKTLKISQIGQNSESFFGIHHSKLLGENVSTLIGAELSESLRTDDGNEEFSEVNELELNGRHFVMIPHISGDSLILDFEPVNKDSNPYKYQKQLTRILNILGASDSPESLCIDAARITKNIFGYDRVMIYKFDEEWNGQVIAEEKEDELESWLGLHYPAGDIPKQSRELFLRQRIRIISNVNYKPIPIEPALSPVSGEPLDLSRSQLRGVSPIHIEYLQNMKVGASLTAALISNGKLWGLLACHHYSEKYINYYQRQTCDFLTQIFSNELTLKETNRYLSKLDEWSKIKSQLIEQIGKKGRIKKGLLDNSVLFTDLLDCSGGAVFYKNKLRLVGETPSKTQVKSLIKDFLSNNEETLFFTKNLVKVYPPAQEFLSTASGVLSVKLGESDNDFLIWFRPEVVQNLSWGGNPKNKASFDESKQRMTPRKSFEKWTQELTGYSESWKDYQISAAKAIRENLSSIILEKQKKEIEKLNKKIVTAHKELELFSQGLSHDLKGPLRGVEGYAQIIKEDYFDVLDKDGKQAVETILKSSSDMRDIIDNILSFAGISSKNIKRKSFNLNSLLDSLINTTNPSVNYPNTTVKIANDLPNMRGDKKMIARVWSNLLSNAFKYSEFEDKPEIEIGSTEKKGKVIYFIRDNGVGIDPANSEKIFNLFSRFSGSKFKGTGIGLAIAHKIIEKHQGKIWVESETGKGSTFYFHV
ncbi:ATP-binding protein [Christiangramia salexigens]|uniref:histidine kinase n=1 Tax=Christiangramia salexigens TaxID=1913577 RepID=A0A1L3J2G4_9FLAO|nr:ATP-binding protein [Christiangramia salexigens]APG59315.1 hypothetical protein LPB144_02305 [Christiangramia salexigens]